MGFLLQLFACYFDIKMISLQYQLKKGVCYADNR